VRAVDVPACPVCGGLHRRRLPPPGHRVADAFFAACAPALGLVACRGCGFVFASPRPDDATLAAFYDQQDYTASNDDDAAGAALAVEHQLAFLAREGVAIGPGVRLLDVGCGGGFLLAAARDRGAEVLGFDAGSPSRDACAARGLPVTGDAAGLRGFDIVAISHTLEHVPDLGATLALCRDALAPGGRLLIEVPNVRSLRARAAPPWATRLGAADERYRAFPVHLSYFAPPTLRTLLVRHGLADVAMTTRGLGIALPRRRRAPAQAPSSVASTAQPQPAARTLKSRARAAFLDALLGENLLALARAR
jgi:SAM-dependent methyltransferase